MRGNPDNFTMMISAILLNLLLLSHLTVSEEQVQKFVIGEKDQNITLQCFGQPFNVSPVVYQWKRNSSVVATQNFLKPFEHLSVLNNGSLRISGLQFPDEGLYECESKTRDSSSWKTISNVQLKIAAGPSSVSLSIQPETRLTRLSNGTFFVKRGSDLNFNCSSPFTYPSQNLNWTVEDLASDNSDRAFGTNSALWFSIKNIEPKDQGRYTCTSQNTLSMTTVNKSLDLLVYYAPERHPECSWELDKDPSVVLFICTWFGGYPVPTLDWYDKHVKSVTSRLMINSTPKDTERLDVRVNRSRLYDEGNVTCSGKHVTGVTNECFFTLKMPYPLGQPLVTALEGSTITLTCTENMSLPPARTVWKRKDDIINNTSKYIVSDERPTFKLTILNISKADEGVYFCYSENPLGPRELEVFLTVKTSAENGGAVVGLFVSILIIMIGIVVGVTVYTKRDRICIGLGFTHLDDEMGDVLSLVDSDEEEIFHDTTPRLPPLTNGHATTLVEIHRIPSTDHEDVDGTEHTDQNEPEQTEPVQHTPDC